MNKNKKNIALVTESGNGMAKSFASILSENDYTVVIAACKKSYQILSEENNSKTICDKLIEIDFTSDKELIKLAEYFEKLCGKLDLLVNNAEIVNGFGQKIEKISLAEVKELYEINFFSVINIIQKMKPLLEKSNHPKIINITSALGDINKMKSEKFCYADYYLTAYATSKAALNMFTHLQCKEFSPSKIKVYGFDPIVQENCTRNSVLICNQIKDDFIALI